MLEEVEVIWVLESEEDGPEELEVDDASGVVEVIASGDVVVAPEENALIEAVVDDIMDIVFVDSKAVLEVVDWPELVV